LLGLDIAAPCLDAVCIFFEPHAFPASRVIGRLIKEQRP
jgi:hypothetical protein